MAVFASFTAVFHVSFIASFMICTGMSNSASNWRPVVLMHGMNGDAKNLLHLKTTIEERYPGIYVHDLNISNGLKSVFHNMPYLMNKIVETIRADPKLKDGFNFYGESQGALQARTYVSMYNDPPVYNLVSICGPQAGVGECPTIVQKWKNLCADAGTMLQIYDWPVCDFCSYWKDNRDETDYQKRSKWLAEVNNEQGSFGAINETYAKRMRSLNKYMATRALKDEIVLPSESAHHRFWKWGDETRAEGNILPLEETEGYINDWLGLKTLNERGDLILNEIDTAHIKYNMTWWKKHVLPMFNNKL